MGLGLRATDGVGTKKNTKTLALSLMLYTWQRRFIQPQIDLKGHLSGVLGINVAQWQPVDNESGDKLMVMIFLFFLKTTGHLKDTTAYSTYKEKQSRKKQKTITEKMYMKAFLRGWNK